MKVALLFLTRNNVHHPDIWEEFFAGEVGDRCVVRIHPKPDAVGRIHPAWKPFLVANPVETVHGEISLVTAMNRLLLSALEDSSVERFVLLSESTIPLRRFDEVYDRLVAEPRSQFWYSPDEQCWPRCEPLLEHLPRPAIKKTHQWAILNRRHAEAVVACESECIGWFESLFAADEHYWVCMLHRLGLEAEIADAMTTYVDWREGGLRTFGRLSATDIDRMLASPALFARKFRDASNARRLWRRVVGQSERPVRAKAEEGPQEAVWLFGDGRSGTTWLANVINHDQRLAYYFEPIHFGDADLVGRVGGLRPTKYMSVDREAPALEGVVDEILRLRFAPRRQPPPDAKQGVLVKDIFANLMIGWLGERWPWVKKILLVRHPFAVAASKVRLEERAGWQFAAASPEVLAQYDLQSDFLGPYESLFAQELEPFEAHVLAWAVAHYVPLSQLGKDDIHVVFYEDLLDNPAATSNELFRFLYGDQWRRHRWPAPRSAFDEPSHTSSDRVFAADAWIPVVSEGQRRRGRAILQHFGVDTIYDQEGRPNHGAVDALLSRPAPVIPYVPISVRPLWLHATLIHKGAATFLVLGPESDRSDLAGELERRGWRAGLPLTAAVFSEGMDRAEMRSAGEAVAGPISAIIELSSAAGAPGLLPLGPGEATIGLAACLLASPVQANDMIASLGALATRVSAGRLCFQAASLAADAVEAHAARLGLPD